VSDASAGERWARARAALVEALELPDPERRGLLDRLRAEDPALAREVADLLRHAESDDPFLDGPALSRLGGAVPDAAGPAAGAPERIGPWRLEREIGRGGMGVVWRATRDDGTFAQTVAIKLVRPELASDLLRRRLVGEMRILASLEHESIARLLDGGATPDGVPYLVLEHVAGRPIDLHCDAEALSLAARLALLREVCAAVEFAHRRLVLHRDLKSSNILVDERGRPKLLDFGIAKLLGGQADGEEWTALGFERPLTPEWASPEQLRGEELTTASDVYSLGVLLHVLLTGRRPHRWTGQRPEQFAREIEASGGLPAPGLAARALAPGVERGAVRRELEYVVAKALAPAPAERYATVEALRAEIDRFVAGRPVLAHPPTAFYRFRKYLGRHRAGAAATAFTAASLLVATGVSLRQAKIAERRLGEVRELANRFLFELEDAIRDLPGATPARERIVRIGLEYLDRLAAEAGSDRGQRLELAEGYVKLGDVQGGYDRASLGDAGGAIASYRKAIALLEPAPADALGDPAHALALVRAWTSAAVLEGREGESELALGRLEHAGELATALVGHPVVGGEALAARALARFRRATILQTERSDLSGARHDLDWALADAAAAEAAGAATFDRDGVVGRIRVGRAVLETQVGNWAAAKAELERAREADEQLVARRPTSAIARQWLAADHVRLADVHLYLDELDLAAQRAEEGLRRFEDLFADDPANRQAEYFVAWAANRLGDIRMTRGEDAAAEAAAIRAREIVRGMLAREPGSARNRWVMGIGEARVASLEARRGDHGAASATFQRSIDSYRAAMAADPDNPVYEIDLAVAIGNLARSRAAAGDLEGALARYREALEIGERRRGPDAGPRPDLVRIDSFAGTARIEARRGNSARACEQAALAAEAMREVPEDPEVIETRNEMERLLRGCPPRPPPA
jgi:tetratricopeptide (TPR) repeat protein